MQPTHRLALKAALFLLALPFLLGACGDNKRESETRPQRPVLVETVHYQPRTPERSFVATIRPRIESDLGFRVPGKVARRLVSVGDSVAAGQALATLDETDLRLQLVQAEAERDAAKASLAQAESELKRVTTLRGEGWSATATVERQRAATEEARGRLARAVQSLNLATNALSYATLQADAAGVITATQIEPGQVVAAGQPAIRLARLEEKEAVAAIPETLTAFVRNGSARVSLWSDAAKVYQASLRELAPAADPVTRTYQARFSIPKAGDDIRLGMTATVIVSEGAGEKVARLPLSSLFNQGGGPSLWVVKDDGSLILKPVEIVAYEGRDILVRSGVSDGDRVVTLGVQKLDQAQKVRVVQSLEF